MEHRLIQGDGGEIYLPFARSRIKALKALGIPYANQSYEIDGISIKVRIEPGQEYIRIEGGSQVLKMDSGAVNIGAIGPAAPARYHPGTLYESGPALTYNAGFMHVDSLLSRIKPSKLSEGQFTGVITKKTKFSGRIFDECRSFFPKKIAVTPATDPPTQAQITDDDLLHAKKVVGILCPASIFTGKCRLYVQAMYGLHLYEYGDDGKVKRTNPPLSFVSETSSAPELWLPSYRAPGDKAEYPDMLLNTSCGVWLDESTGKHWLIKPGTTGGAMVYPLKSIPEAEKLRGYLIPKSGANSPFQTGIVDREHLEAYILAYSLPDQKHAQTCEASGPSTGGVYPICYGWHWNWSGETLVGDLVNVGWYEQDPTGYNVGNVSTHFRMTIAKENVQEPMGGFKPDQPRQLWRAAVKLIEGPKQWSVLRAIWTIVAPNYASMVLEKVTEKHSLQIECDAPFYCFYVRNELKMCRVKVTLHEATEPKRTISDGYGPAEYGAYVPCNTLGLLGGQHQDLSGTSTYHAAVFSCGDEVTPELPWAKVETGGGSKVSTKTIVGEAVWLPAGPPYQTKTYISGYPPYQVSAPIFGIYDDWSFFTTYDLTWRNRHEATNSIASVVVPFYDAEAVYLQYSVDKQTTDTGTIKHMSADLYGFQWVWENRVYYFGEELGRFRRYGWNRSDEPSGANNYSSDPLNTSETVIEAEDQILISRAGTTPATFTNLSEIHSDALEQVSAEYGTLSGTSVELPTVIAPGSADSVGANGASGALVLVGWI